MIVPLIPLFLVANVVVNEPGDWMYGPEAIYKIEFDAFARPQNSSQSQTATTNSTLKLKCRPIEKSALNCRFEEERLVLTLYKSGLSQVMKDTKDFGQEGPGEDAFQLQFDSNGLDEVVVSSSISPGKLDILRALVNQLNVGWNLRGEETPAKSSFNVLERSAAGECDTNCELLFVPKILRKEAPRVNSYEIVNIRGSKSPELTLRGLRKMRNLEKCLFRADYFYGSRETGRVPLSVVNTTLVSSTSKMTITETDLISHTENVVTVDDKMIQGVRTIITERITLTLEDIVPADGHMPKINNPSRASIFPTTWLLDVSAEESEESSLGQSIDESADGN